MTDVNINIAEVLREITAECDKTTGKALRACEKAAKNGQSFIIINGSTDDWNCLCHKDCRLTPFVEKIRSLGFNLEAIAGQAGTNWWSCESVKVKISW